MTITATYSPDDNKLRLYASARLDADTYAKVRAAGFKWAPKQDLFVAPAWTPEREDLALELAGDIDDEDTSLTERAEVRAERFEGYSENRREDADRAHAAVKAIADCIPFGQPILVGHHSERRARRDAEKIENGMRRAVKAFKTSQYWTARAAGALRHAKYKELPAVRARRIKGLEADRRKQQKWIDRSEAFSAAWRRLGAKKDGTPIDPRAHAVIIANQDGGYWNAKHEYKREDGTIYHVGPMGLWEAAGGNIHGKPAEEAAIASVEDIRTKALANHAGVIARAARWVEHFDNRLAYERAMLAEDGGTVADKTGPEKGGGCKCWASHRGAWSHIVKVNRISVTVLDNWGNGGGNFTRTIPFDKLSAVMTAAQVQAAREAGRLHDTADGTGFVLADAPAPTAEDITRAEARQDARAEREADAAPFEAMAESLRAGVQTVTAPSLFPTPPDVAAELVRLADIRPGMRVLEPSAGTSRLIIALHTAHGKDLDLTAVEIKPHLANVIRTAYRVPTFAADFLTCNGVLGTFDRIVMNPPFNDGADIKHIRHALGMLNDGGRLVAICAAGPRQHAALAPLGEWRPLPAGTFAGTNVSAAIVVIDK